MDKDYADTDVVSLNSLKKISKYQEKIKCRGPILRSNSFGNVHSRYLKEPIGSCHNLCKYGRKHESEHDEKHLTFKRFMANNIALETGQNLVKVPSTVDIKKKIVAKMEPSNTGKAVEENIQPKKVGIFDKSIEINMSTLLSRHRRTVSSPQFIHPELPNNEIIDSKFLNGSKNKKQVNKPKISSMPKSTSVEGNILKQNSSASTIADSEDNTNILEEKILSNLKESTTSTPLEVIKQKSIVVRKQSASSKLQSNNQNASFSSKKTNSSATSTIPLNVRTPLLRMNQKEKLLNSNEMPEVGEIKLPKPERISISSTISSRSSVSLKTRKSRYAQHAILKKSAKTKDESGEFKEKVFKVIEPKIDGKSLEHRENLSKELDGNAPASAVGEASKHSSNGQIQRKYKHGTNSKEEDKRRARRIPAAQQPADSSSSPYKLKFKRGKVIELRTADSVVPRRLRFRSGRVLGENPSAEVTKRSFRRKRDIGDSNEHNSKAHAVMLKKANLESQVGMLKHQDARGKKEIRTLFNHVIEETASKLVETRKSKVKALVGAFETVISLQEAKPASML